MAMQISVHIIDGASFSLHVARWNTILHVAQLIEKHHGIPIALQQLAFQDVLLELDRTLGWYNIQHSDILTLVKLPIQVSFDQAKTAYHNIGLRQEEDWYGAEWEVDAPSEIQKKALKKTNKKNIPIEAK